LETPDKREGMGQYLLGSPMASLSVCVFREVTLPLPTKPVIERKG
jgi:hypothetical protein